MKTVLTGVKPTGKIHLGNYIGAIKPALQLALNPDYQPIYFVADYHGLTKTQNAEEMQKLSTGVASAWLALGLDPEKVIFYRQSDIPEIFELSWVLACFSPKGLMNRAHAYKSLVDQNKQAGKESDDGVNMGLFTYPILMAADILMFHTDIVPVGKDQIQHVEIARDIAEYFNKNYGETFTLPEFKVEEETAVLPGLDGRKMSKSYNNTIPLFEDADTLYKLIKKIKTDSTPPNEPKDPNQSIIFELYKEFASPEKIQKLKEAYANGIGWGDAKKELFDVMNSYLEEPREKYHELMANPKKVNEILLSGAEQARQKSIPFMKEIRRKIGLMN
ncbi:tryptophan--tRNA ligase [Heyndrickxia shackletonii]|uniref:Tryptophan--tRNA ligase n=1 Tax=Heyndrickxia shackletonii TaxID=157838 RepID=A0A0Q3T9I5_9BACI|nr:tryptophan--tRNA ligase [Heyndrickxia shackletonii]KQL50702.1 tryptophan--tRNA ligase [Heyndrickxia shackletonii]MBB2482435.1 tryptophan--tRNA ligase [Bacillus sp. APMAM]NEY97961.1 tryptophan--tRNA ligase [Heyndrickxia shackletonii]RTZ54224.1 tryptophan--tRNA ligase [Bacillus sp. SAJ1]